MVIKINLPSVASLNIFKHIRLSLYLQDQALPKPLVVKRCLPYGIAVWKKHLVINVKDRYLDYSWVNDSCLRSGQPHRDQ
jgi:hypothetical protein